jgi:predicted ATPase
MRQLNWPNSDATEPCFMISLLAIEGYRSLREVIIWLEQLNVVSGPNGSGKSSL